jgi:hypothetical protein
MDIWLLGSMLGDNNLLIFELDFHLLIEAI